MTNAEHRRILECLDPSNECSWRLRTKRSHDPERRGQFIERTSVILAESPATYHAWRQLLTAYHVQGVAVHDARLVAMMQTAGISYILTLNAGDFARYTVVTSVTPRDVVAAMPST